MLTGKCNLYSNIFFWSHLIYALNNIIRSKNQNQLEIVFAEQDFRLALYKS
jgi:hypothetical protein